MLTSAALIQNATGRLTTNPIATATGLEKIRDCIVFRGVKCLARFECKAISLPSNWACTTIGSDPLAILYLEGVRDALPWRHATYHKKSSCVKMWGFTPREGLDPCASL
jgi:hypothetical protein